MNYDISKKRWFLIVLFIVLCILAVYFSIKDNKLATILSTLGSIASLYAIIEALLKVKSIEAQNEEIKKAVESKVTSINKQETKEQISKYVEVIARIQTYIANRNAEAALLKIEELQIFLHNILCNPTSSEENKKALAKHQRTIKQDVLVLRDKTKSEQFPKDADCKELYKHFEALHDTLISYSQQIHFDK